MATSVFNPSLKKPLIICNYVHVMVTFHLLTRHGNFFFTLRNQNIKTVIKADETPTAYLNFSSQKLGYVSQGQLQVS